MCKELLVVLDVDDAPALPLHYCCLLSLVKAVLLFVFFVKKVVQQVSSDCMSIVVCVCVHGSSYSYRTETFPRSLFSMNYFLINSVGPHIHVTLHRVTVYFRLWPSEPPPSQILCSCLFSVRSFPSDTAKQVEFILHSFCHLSVCSLACVSMFELRFKPSWWAMGTGM